MTDDQLLKEYKRRHRDYLVPMAQRLEAELRGHIGNFSRIDRIAVRAKDPDRFLQKALKELDGGGRKYKEPLDQIQDQIGARIIVFYLSDVEAISHEVGRYFRSIEARALIPEDTNKFGYIGKHYVMALNEDVFDDDADKANLPEFFELQVKTLFQHAWSEAEHDLAYKPDNPLTEEQERQIAFTAAQAWGADYLFNKLQGSLARDI